MDDKPSEKDERKNRGSRETHTDSGAPKDEAHREAGDGTLTGSVPAGLTPEELRKAAEDDETVEPGTG